MELSSLEILIQGIKTKQSTTDDLYNIMLASKTAQKYPKMYRLIGQLAVKAAASSKTEMTPSGHVFPYRVNFRSNLVFYALKWGKSVFEPLINQFVLTLPSQR